MSQNLVILPTRVAGGQYLTFMFYALPLHYKIDRIVDYRVSQFVQLLIQTKILAL